MKKIVCLCLAVIMLIIQLPAFAANTKPELPEYYKTLDPQVGNRTPFQPIHQYICMQNPPNFSWTSASVNANYDEIDGYDVIVCSDEELTDVKYAKYGIKWHYCTFAEPFEPGLYYWAVRYYAKGNKTPSDWSVVRRFRISEDAYDFTVPDDFQKVVDDIPVTHPRIYMTQENREEFLKRGTTEAGKSLVNSIINNAESRLGSKPVEIPEYDKILSGGNIVSAVSTNCSTLEYLVFAYQFTGEKKYAEKAREFLMEMASYDVNGNTSYETQDQAHYALILSCAYGYDWLWEYLSESDRKVFRDMMKKRLEITRDYMIPALRNNPRDSHSWAYTSYYAYALISVMHEVEEAKEMFLEFLELYIPSYVPHSTEDGGWAVGTAYWSYGFPRSIQLPFWFSMNTDINFFAKPWARNAYLYPLYMYPAGSYGSFGDESGRTKPGSNHILGLASFAVFTENPVAIWQMKQIGNLSQGIGQYVIPSILYAEAEAMEAREPIDYPRAHTFIDQGVTAMHSDLIDPNRISLYFRADKHGSDGHNHADQNAFMIEAFGERLATKSGYYDSYHSVHDSGFTRKTYAHNTITFDGGTGQLDDSKDANGNTDMFVTSIDYDAVVGDATKAYNGGLEKFVRSIIYVRPDAYIVVDDLKAAKSEGSNFEWWLNADDEIYLHEDKKGASIKRTNAHLDARVQYPENVDGYYIHKFSDPWGRYEINPSERYASSPVQERIWFETEKVKETKMVTTINVHRPDEDGAYVKKTEGENYIKLEFEDGTTAIIGTSTEEDAVISADNFKFKGTALVFSTECIMLVGGTYVELDGNIIYSSDKTSAFVAGKNRLSLSGKDDFNAVVGVNNGFIGKVDNITTYDGKELSIGRGIGCEKNDDALLFTVEKGHFSMLLNDALKPGEKIGGSISVDITVDGVKTTYETDAVLDADGETSGRFQVDFEPTKYVLVDKSDGFEINGVNVGYEKAFTLSKEETVRVSGEGNYAELKSIKSVQCEIEQTDDYDGLKNSSAVIVEAENYDSIEGEGRHTSGVDHFAGITALNKEDSYAQYTVDVPEDGYYDFVIRCSAWNTPYPIRYVQIGDTMYIFELADTGGYGAVPEDLDGFRVKMKVFLKKGSQKIGIGSINSGSLWNYDWLGFIKTE